MGEQVGLAPEFQVGAGESPLALLFLELGVLVDEQLTVGSAGHLEANKGSRGRAFNVEALFVES